MAKRDRSKSTLLRKQYENMSVRFLQDLSKVWETEGPRIIEQIAHERPDLLFEMMIKLETKLPALLQKLSQPSININNLVSGSTPPGKILDASAEPVSVIDQLRRLPTPDDDA